MPYRIIPFVNGGYYHLYNRGLDKQITFANARDYSFFIESFRYYQIANPKPKFSNFRISKIFPVDKTKKIVDIISYCLMPNHFHLLVKQVKEGGVSEFMRKFTHSYTKYRNVKYNRQGSVFHGGFKAIAIETDEQLIHVSRYIHLNPLVAKLVKDLKFYHWSSYKEYVETGSKTVKTEDILNFFPSPKAYEKFVLDQADYATTLHILKHAAIDAEF